MTPRSLLRMLRQRWPWLLLGPLLAAALVIAATRNAIATYASEAILYTGLVSGYTIESTSDDRVDYLTVANAFDNLVNLVTARTTVEETALRLLTRQLLRDPGRLRVFDATHAPPIRALAEGVTDEAVLLERLRAEAQEPESAVYALLFEGKTPFAVQEIREGLSVSRVGASDLLRVRHACIDPLLGQWTLEVLLDVVTTLNQRIKTRETTSVVAFFDREVTRARAALSERVEALRAFGVDNRVINYDEQTKAIAGQKEAIEAELQTERQRQAAAEAVVTELEARMAQQQALALQSDTVLTLRNRLADVTTALALAEGAGTPRPDLRRRADSLETALSAQVAALYDLSTSREGLNRENIAEAWLEKLLDATDARAQVALLQRRLADYDRYYDDFSPLGATLATLEREVDTAERTYLELLQSLNTARMREQNIEMASGLEIVDAPSFPEDPESSNRLLLTAVGAAGCFGLLLTLFLLIELFHPAIRSVERARSITKLNVATAYPPFMPDTPPDGRRPRLRWRGLGRKTDPLEPDDEPGAPASRALRDTLRKLDLHLIRAAKLHLVDRLGHASEDPASTAGDGAALPRILQIAIVGAQAGDGIRPVATRLAMLLRDEFDHVRHVALADRRAPNDAEEEADLGPGFATSVERVVVDDLRGQIGRAGLAIAELSRPKPPRRRRKKRGTTPPSLGHDLAPTGEGASKTTTTSKNAGSTKNAAFEQIQVIELPPLVSHTAPLQVLRDADLAFVVLRADRAWTDADQHALDAVKEAHPHAPSLVLTATHPDFLDGLTARGVQIPPVLRPLFG